VIAPLVVFSAIPAGQAPLCDTVALPDVPSVTGDPLTESLAATLAIAVEAAPAVALPVSATGMIEALTVTVSVTVAQSGGVFLSHS
jgi:predicted anti-sigma-YlaC factor YlaD